MLCFKYVTASSRKTAVCVFLMQWNISLEIYWQLCVCTGFVWEIRGRTHADARDMRRTPHGAQLQWPVHLVLRMWCLRPPSSESLLHLAYHHCISEKEILYLYNTFCPLFIWECTIVLPLSFLIILHCLQTGLNDYLLLLVHHLYKLKALSLWYSICHSPPFWFFISHHRSHFSYFQVVRHSALYCPFQSSSVFLLPQ